MAQLPAYTTPVVLITELVLVGLLIVGASRAAERAGLSAAGRRRVLGGLVVVLGVWLSAAFLVASAGLDTLDPRVLGLIGGPVVLGYAAFRASETWRRVVRAVPQVWLVAGQFYRVIGALFLLLWASGDLPAFFAFPAGVGDVVTGVGAVVVAAAIARELRGWRSATVGWNLFGLADLVVAVGAGSTLLAGPLTTVFAAETSTAVLVAFPLGLIPLFLVPVSTLLHLYSLSNHYANADGAAAGTSVGEGSAGRSGTRPEA